MDIKSSDLVTLFEKALSDIPEPKLTDIGVVVQTGDGICRVHGLTDAVFNELVDFEGGNKGIILDLDQDYVTIFLLYAYMPVAEREIVRRTGGVYKTPVTMKLAGRVINALGKPIDGLGDIVAEDEWPIERQAPGIIERSPVNQSLETGILTIDALVPIGRGQRELIIGNRNTGKTSLAVDTILNQKGKGVFCIYVSIGQRQANIARLMRTLQEQGSMEYTVVVSADSSEAVLNQYLAPYVGCTLGEYFRSKGHDALIVYDDLSNHAVAYREMSLLMRRAPGREAFPGDVFYLHSRLLERAGKLASGASLTALPMVQIQSDDITAYIPTNLISITDGQIFLDTQLFNAGVRPAVNIELSVSRVGGSAQTKAIRKMTRALRLELAQYHALLDFAQFGAELDPLSQKRLERGKIVIELIKQSQLVHYSFIDEALMLFVLRENYLDTVALWDVRRFAVEFTDYTQSVYPDIYKTIKDTQDISDEIVGRLKDVVSEFSKIFKPTKEPA